MKADLDAIARIRDDGFTPRKPPAGEIAHKRAGLGRTDVHAATALAELSKLPYPIRRPNLSSFESVSACIALAAALLRPRLHLASENASLPFRVQPLEGCTAIPGSNFFTVTTP